MFSQKSSKAKLRFSDEKVDVSHKNIVLKNLAQKIASSDSLDDEYESDASNGSTLSEGAISKTRKLSPKFASEPNLSILEAEETPKNTKKRLFRSKVLSASSYNKKYRKRKETIRGTPTCVSCFEDQDTASENDTQPEDLSPVEDTPIKVDRKINYLTSTPGVPEVVCLEGDCSTPYVVNFRRASMSPITKSTQKLSKAMQVGCLACIMLVFML